MNEQLELPDTTLPFLIYGIYKPNASKWKKIKNVGEIEIIDNPDIHIEKIVPLTINGNKGYLIYFDKNHSKEAYEYISNKESKDYEWKSLKIDRGPYVNFLIQKPKPKNNDSFPDKFDFKKPFFAYGIFKPGQIAFPKISEYVESIKKTKLNKMMILMDAMAMVSEQSAYEYLTNGYLIYFKDEYAKKAYEIISETEPDKIYVWKTLPVHGITANVLIGNHPKMNSPFNKVITNYSSAKDPFFKDAIKLIENEKNSRDFFKLQMNYLLLWAVIERFSVLKYNEKNSTRNNMRFAGEEKFKNYLENEFNNDVKSMFLHERSVFSPKKFRDIEFDVEDPEKIIEYYYAIRCNVAHRGKALNELGAIRESLNELLVIFKEILSDTFNIVTICGIDFYIPFGFIALEKIIDKNSIKIIFGKDDSIGIGGIQDYKFKIIIEKNSDFDKDYRHFNGNRYEFIENQKLVKIVAQDIHIKDLLDEMFID